MRLKRFHLPIRNIAGRAVGLRARRWALISASTVAVFAGGYNVTAGALEPAAQPTAAASPAPPGSGVASPAVMPYLSPKMLKAVPVGPEAVSRPVQRVLTSSEVITALGADGIPEVALQAYQHAATTLAVTDPACHMPWQLVAAIGRVESDDGRFGGSMLLANGNTTKTIYGIPLDGRPGVALVRDTVDAELDGYSYFAMAVGPMQFLPATWAEYGADGNGDGKKDPSNIFDAALAAADYLCADGGNMTNPAQETAAVLRYNDADDYARVVLALAASYENGGAAIVPAAGPAPAAIPTQTPPAQPAAAPSPTTAPTPRVNPTATPAPGPSPSPTPTSTTQPSPAPSGEPSPAPQPSATPLPHAGQTVNIGWAPAMRKVVLQLLDAPKTAPAQPAAPTPGATTAAAAPTPYALRRQFPKAAA